MKNENKKSVKNDQNEKISRRGFLKKAAYKAPVLIAMGELAKPKSLMADGGSGNGNPYPHPGWW